MNDKTTDVLIIGAGAAGLYAADILSSRGLRVDIADRMRAPARKFLLAGRGGLNISHSEDLSSFLKRYREAEAFLAPHLHHFQPTALRDWCHSLGQATFVGSSGRVFPKAMKASPLLRALLQRLFSHNVALHSLHHWTGLGEKNACTFQLPDTATRTIEARAVLLALGGASWPRLGSDGSWQPILQSKGVSIAPFRPSNCGFNVEWSTFLKTNFAGTRLKRIALRLGEKRVLGEALISEQGIEGGAVYALSADIRKGIEQAGRATLHVDLRPDFDLETLTAKLTKPRGKQSFPSWLRKAAGLGKLQIALLRENGTLPDTPLDLAQLIKACPIPLTAPYSIDRAISSAGGVRLDELNENLMLKKLPAVYAVGEMLDWEAPTGGYLLQACYSMAHSAATSIIRELGAPKQKEL
ncbi:hypothetical protein TRICHSKD4_6221 [Roseibium sp. TrichSKD4]|uniref:TIGR03862 family flavoprotein n=1 Tax=Roseibium sp. TrichSKD4 TaxID=744980 RepID=UPI0001E572FE|nr:TIGR03862 family flavoprotein [Roseibium sp. TrichSKD4]EFO28518.1 hypothetical protein TRICHSKD4_6221 [Roseibium sp. TrichSKD4]